MTPTRRRADDGEADENDMIAADVESALGGTATTRSPATPPTTTSTAGPAATPSTAAAAPTRVTYATRDRVGHRPSTAPPATARPARTTTSPPTSRTSTGGSGDDTLTGDAGPNSLDGGPGADTLDGGAGADALDGGSGTDTVTYAIAHRRASPPTSTARPTTARPREGDNIATDVENLTGGTAADTLTGDAGANVLDGGAGAGRR